MWIDNINLYNLRVSTSKNEYTLNSLDAKRQFLFYVWIQEMSFILVPSVA